MTRSSNGKTKVGTSGPRSGRSTEARSKRLSNTLNIRSGASHVVDVIKLASKSA